MDEKNDLLSFDAALDQALGAGTDLPTGDFGAAFLKMIISLAVLIGLMVVTVWFMRRLIQQRLLKGSSGQSIHLVEKKMISPKTMLYIVEIEGKRVLLAESQLEIRKLQTLDETETT
jgi:flagellar protein FliO/FliZ